jgi:hypothetical protein
MESSGGIYDHNIDPFGFEKKSREYFDALNKYRMFQKELYNFGRVY